MPPPANRLRAGLSELFFNFLPSVIFGLVGILLEECARFFTVAARRCNRTRRTTSFIKLPRVPSFRRQPEKPDASPAPLPAFSASRAVVTERLAEEGSDEVRPKKTKPTVALLHSSPVSPSSQTTRKPTNSDYMGAHAVETENNVAKARGEDVGSESLEQIFEGGEDEPLSSSSTVHTDMSETRDDSQLCEDECLSVERKPAAPLLPDRVVNRSARDGISSPMKALVRGELMDRKTVFDGPLGQRVSGRSVNSQTSPKSSLVARRISAYENLVTNAKYESDGPLKIPRPSSPVLGTASPVLSSKLAISLPRPENGKDTIAEPLWQLSRNDDDASSGHVVEADDMFEDADDDDGPESGSQVGQAVEEVMEGGTTEASRQKVVAEVGRSGSCYLESIPSPGLVAIEKPTPDNGAEAPPGAESLQELIPEVLPEVDEKDEEEDEMEVEEMDTNDVEEDTAVVTRKLFSTAVDPGLIPELKLDDVGVVDMGSIGNLGAYKSLKGESSTSLNTESYSSPGSPEPPREPSPEPSPAPSPPMRTLPSGRHRNSRNSSRPSDLLLFSEDPMISCDDLEGRERNKKKTLGLNDSGSLVDGTRMDHCSGEDYDSARMIVGLSNRNRQSSSSDRTMIRASTPVTKSSDDISWQKPFSEGGDFSNRDRPRSSRNRRGMQGDSLFRQASADVNTLNRSSGGERQRSGFGMSRSSRPRFHPSRLTSKVSLPARGGRLGGGVQFTERSASTFESGFQDWPEYTPSAEDMSAMARRHMSDMSFGIKARQEAMLPKDVFAAVSEDAVYGPDAPSRFGGSARQKWKKFGLSTPRSSGGGFRSIIRRRKKPFVQEESHGPAKVQGTLSHHRPADRSGQRTGAAPGEFTFDIELSQETVFTLLERICPECAFAVAVRRPNHKMKIAVPCDGIGNPLLISIGLAKTSNKRGTAVYICRSRDDQSMAPVKDVEAAAVVLRRNLSGHVEFIEDSFASMSVTGSALNSQDTPIFGRG